MTEATFYWTLLAVWFVLALAAFVALLFKPAPYGRFSESARGPKLSPKVAWLLMESPASILVTLLFFLGEHKNLVAISFLIIWNLHYGYRGFIYPMLIRGNRKVPLSIVLSAACFQVINSYLQARWLFTLGEEYPLSWLHSGWFLVGLVMFLVGLIITLSSDAILRALRTRGEKRYQIPHGGFFRWVSCPHYFGEILEWSAWAMLTWSLPGLAFAAWTVANLLPRALAHQRWYHETFPEYPPERTAVIPFLL